MIKVFAPATVSNVACGFDVMGFAIEGLGDVVTARLEPGFSGIKIEKIIGDGGKLPYDIAKNTASIAVAKWMEKAGYGKGVVLTIEKKMPFASGLGSSAASAAAAVRAVNLLRESPLDENRLLECVIHAEEAIGGTAHADNAAPALLGGFVLVRSLNPLDVIKLPVPTNLFCSVVHADVHISTGEARNALPLEIPLKTAVQQWANTAALVQALNSGDLALLARAMLDAVAEPVRAKNIPFYNEVKQAAAENGALASTISGSGPAMFAFSDSVEKAQAVASAMKNIYKAHNIKCLAFSGGIREAGAVAL